MENIWVSLFSFAMAMIPLLILGIILSASSKIKRKLKLAQNVNEIKQIYRRSQRCIKCKTAFGLTFFALFSNFLLLYIICFCHIASDRKAQDWARSSGILVILDLVVLELLPAFLFGILGLFYGFCRTSNSMLCLILVIELYRLYRNLIEV